MQNDVIFNILTHSDPVWIQLDITHVFVGVFPAKSQKSIRLDADKSIYEWLLLFVNTTEK